MSTVTAAPKFQVAIPVVVRERLKLLPGAKPSVVECNRALRLLPLRSAAELRGMEISLPQDADRPL